MNLSRRGDRSPLPGRRPRTAAPAVAERQAVTQEIAAPAPPPETTARTEVITPPAAQAPAPELVNLGAREDGLGVFEGRPLSGSVAVREAWFRENQGPEQIFDGLIADLAAWRQAATDPGPAPDGIPGSGPAGPVTKPVPEAARPPAGEEAGAGAVQASPVASGTAASPGPGTTPGDAAGVSTSAAHAVEVPGPASTEDGTAGSGMRPPAKKRARAAGA